MAAQKDNTKLNLPWTAVSADILTFLRTPFAPLPAAKPLDFDSLFGGKLTEDARALLKQVSEQRGKLLDVLNDKKSDARNVIAAVDAYLPALWRMTASMQASSQSLVKLNKKMEFKWVSPLNKKGKEYHADVLLFEVAFVLTTRAFFHRDAAKIVMEQGGDFHQEMGRELRCAAGIFDFLGNDLLARWSSPLETRAPELVPLVHHCLTALFLADAQRIAIAKALGPDASALTIARLLLGAAEKYEFATRNLQKVDKETFDNMLPGLLEELGAIPAILRGCASNCMAQVAWAKGEYGRGLGLAIDGARRLQNITMGKGLQSSALQAALNAAISRALALEDEYQNDCDKVYFEKASKDLKLPDAVFIINALPYVLPPAEVVNFAESPMAASTAKMPIQNFWSSLWAKAEDYPANRDEKHTAAKTLSGATDLPGVTESLAAMAMPVAAATSASSGGMSAPPGVDPAVFASLPPDIQKELLAEASAASGGRVSM